MNDDQVNIGFPDKKQEDTGVSEENSDDLVEEEKPLDFDTAMNKLKDLARELESGNLSLEEAMENYEKGLELIGYCEERLEEAETLVQEIDDTDPQNPSFNEKDPPNDE